jgi:hypothetical protein
MNETTYLVTLSASGNHSVSISGNDPEALNKALEHGRQLLAHATGESATAHVEAETQTQVPTCPTHKRTMSLQQGRKGPFWNCPTKDENGKWCDYKRDAK